jgi:hypothetical protein
LNNAGAIRQIAICFKNGAIDGLDATDSKSPDVDENLPVDMYLALGNTEYVMSGTEFNSNKKFALGFKNNVSTTYKMQVADIINFTGSNTIYLHDKETNLYHDIKNSIYEFTLPAGVNNTKYEITFTQGTLSTNQNLITNLDVFQNNANATLSIKNPKGLEISNCGLYDVAVKNIFRKSDLGTDNSHEFNTSRLSDGVYIVKIMTTDKQELSKKVIISNSK